MCFDLESEGQIEQSRFDLSGRDKNKQTNFVKSEHRCRVVRAVDSGRVKWRKTIAM